MASSIHANASQYPWFHELEKTVVHSLVTSFGLDFLLFQDKTGGNVDTIHNVRKQVWANASEQQHFEERGDYSKMMRAYHRDPRYIGKGKKDAQSQQAGLLEDGYTFDRISSRNGVRDLDHVIATKSIHDDAGRLLARLDGVELANHESNLVSTHRSINRTKQALPVEDFLAALPAKIAKEKALIRANRKTLAAMPRNTPRQRHQAEQLEARLNKAETRLKALQSVQPDAMREKDAKARKQYERTIHKKYYTSSKFWKAAGTDAGSAGVRMGTRQMLGLVAAEIWFELRKTLPLLQDQMRKDFSLSSFLQTVEQMLKGIWRRVRTRFKDFLVTFKDGMFSGFFGSATTTLINIVATSSKTAVKLIREVWTQITSALKLLVFNPNRLSAPELAKAILAALSAGVATAMGSIIYAELTVVLQFPFGGELAAFISALATGIMTLGLHHVLLHSKIMTAAWKLLQRSNSHDLTARQFKALNTDLDKLLDDIGRVELNVNVDELEDFSLCLHSAPTEKARGSVIAKAIKKRGITLPYKLGDAKSTREWLASLAK